MKRPARNSQAMCELLFLAFHSFSRDETAIGTAAAAVLVDCTAAHGLCDGRDDWSNSLFEGQMNHNVGDNLSFCCQQNKGIAAGVRLPVAFRKKMTTAISQEAAVTQKQKS